MLSAQSQAVYDSFKGGVFKKIFSKAGEEFREGVLTTFRGDVIKPEKKYTDKYQIENIKVEGCNCFHYVNDKAQKTVLYIHGGGYFIDLYDSHWEFSGEMLDKANVEVYLPQYPITPENNCDPTFKMLLSLYQDILKKVKPEDVIVMGDSAGGGIALAFGMLLREKKLPQPKELVLISPCLKLSDVTAEEKEEADRLEDIDPMISYKCMETVRKMWGGDRAKEDYMVNPFYGDIKGLAPITMFSGTWDVLYLFNKEFYARTKEEGIHVDFYVRDEMIHDYILLPVEAAEQDKQIIFDIINR